MAGLKRMLMMMLAAGLLPGLWAQVQIDVDPGAGATTTTGPAITVPPPKASSGAAPAAPAPATPPLAGKPGDLSELLAFTNGDLLHGVLVAADAKAGITWQRPDVAAPVVYSATKLRGVRLQKRVGELGETARIDMTNGDVIYGQVVGLKEGKLEVQTTYGGLLSLRQPMVAAISPASGSGAAIYSGPGKLEDWVRQGDWKLLRGQLTGTGQIGRDLKFPDVAHLSMDIAWKSAYPNFQFSLFTSDPRNNNANCYMLNIGGTNISLMRNIVNRGGNNVFNINQEDLNRMRKIHLDLYTNKTEKSIAIYFNGSLIRQWTDPQEWGGSGTGMTIYSHDQNASMSFGSIRVTKWDGRLPSAGAAAGGAGAQDLIELANDDRVSGTLKTITDGTVNFETPFAPAMAIPLKRITRLNLAPDKNEKPRRNASDVELYFPTGEHVTVKLASLSDRQLKGNSEALGDVTFDLNTFVGLRFNLYTPDEDTITVSPVGADGSNAFSDWLRD